MRMTNGRLKETAMLFCDTAQDWHRGGIKSTWRPKCAPMKEKASRCQRDMYTCHGTQDAEGQILCDRTDDLRSSCSSKALRPNANELRNEEATCLDRWTTTIWMGGCRGKSSGNVLVGCRGNPDRNPQGWKTTRKVLHPSRFHGPDTTVTWQQAVFV